MQIALGFIIIDVAIGWKDFMQQVAIVVKVNDGPQVLRDNIITGKHHRALGKALTISVSTMYLLICKWKVHETNHPQTGINGKEGRPLKRQH